MENNSIDNQINSLMQERRQGFNNYTKRMLSNRDYLQGFDENYYTSRLHKLDRQFSNLTKTKKTGKSFANLRAVCAIYTKNDWKKLEEFYNDK